MANFAGVLKELEQERDRLNQVIQVIGNFVGRIGSGARLGDQSERSRRRRGGKLRSRRRHDGQRQGGQYWHPCAR